MLKEAAKAKVPKTQAMTKPVILTVEDKNEIIGFIS
jgi:hypothetical protein